jgi:glutamate--cysteine ligase catalytic subunit
MGLLTSGCPLGWWDALPHLDYIREHGIEQFVNVFTATRQRQGDVLKWGDEIEYTILVVNEEDRRTYLSLRAPEVILELQREEEDADRVLVTALRQRLTADDRRPEDSLAQVPETLWRPEYANWMVEGTPGVPYSCYMRDLVLVEQNMALRRAQISRVLRPQERVLSLTAYPLLGCGRFCVPPGQGVCGPLARSLYLPDAVINPHPRFGTLTRNIRLRRGHPVAIHVPVYRDKKTPSAIPIWEGGCRHGAEVDIDNRQIVEELLSETASSSDLMKPAATPSRVVFEGLSWSVSRPDNSDELELLPVDSASADGLESMVVPRDAQRDGIRYLCETAGLATLNDRHLDGKRTGPDIYMDAMGFGMGLCCLQITLQAANMDEGRYLYDQLAVLAPVMLALTAATPALRGFLTDTDVRWNVISASVDDRTPLEYSLGCPPKSRYSSIDCFISNRPEMKVNLYNDMPVLIHERSYHRLRQAGVDERLARHVAHLFIRDPLVIFDDFASVDDQASLTHFENLQSTNWNTVRFKPPAQTGANTSAGWRTEFRPMELQITDFENAAFTVFMVLLSRCILAFGMNLYIPISKNEENLGTAHQRDAVLEGKFWFRKHIFSREAELSCSVQCRYRCACGADHCVSFHSLQVGSPTRADSSPSGSCPFRFCTDPDPEATELMTIDEIMNGKPCCEKHAFRKAYPGLITLVRVYLDAMPDLDQATRSRLSAYLDFVAARASGKLLTCAAWMREFITKHPSYRQDSRVTPQACHDLLQRCIELAEGRRSEPALLGEFWPKHHIRSNLTSHEFSQLRSQVHEEDSPQLRGESFREELLPAAASRILEAVPMCAKTSSCAHELHHRQRHAHAHHGKRQQEHERKENKR